MLAGGATSALKRSSQDAATTGGRDFAAWTECSGRAVRALLDQRKAMRASAVRLS